MARRKSTVLSFVLVMMATAGWIMLSPAPLLRSRADSHRWDPYVPSCLLPNSCLAGRKAASRSRLPYASHAAHDRAHPVQFLEPLPLLGRKNLVENGLFGPKLLDARMLFSTSRLKLR